MMAVVSLPPGFREDVALAPLTTLGIGGPARYFLEGRSEEDVRAALTWAHAENLPVFVLGGGSNIVVSDAGFPGLVIHMGLLGIATGEANGRVQLTAAAGEDWDGLVARAVAQDLGGIECLSGIPGTVGGTPVQNVGAYGQDVSQTIVSVRALDRSNGAIVELDRSACCFSYRRSVFNATQRDRFVVLAVTFELQPGRAPSLQYPDLQKEFSERASPSLAEVRDAVLRIRTRKAMVIVPGDPDCRSVGSFFKNPVITCEHYESIAASQETRVPCYPVDDTGHVKVPAAWLIEAAGFSKGYSRGPVGISGRHTLALVNRGGASAAELMELMREVQSRVKDAFAIDLQPEPLFIGFDR